MHVIIPFYNFQQAEIFRENHQRALNVLEERGIRCLVVEAVMPGIPAGGQPDSDFHSYMALFSQSVLWHKEALINEAVRRLMATDGFDGKVAWLDSGCIPGETAFEVAGKLLDRYDLVQGFDQIRKLTPRGTVGSVEPSACKQILVRKRFEFLSPGGLWMSNARIFLEAGGLYDKMIVGGGDTSLARALFRKGAARVYRESPAWTKSQLAWAAVVADCGLSVGLVREPMEHLWHMEAKRKQAQARHQILRDGGYAPESHLRRNDDGLYEWRRNLGPTHLLMAKKVERYLNSRHG